MRMVFRAALAVARAVALMPGTALGGGPAEDPCARFSTFAGQADELAASLDAAASFIASEPRPFERCPGLVAVLRALAGELTEVGDFGRAGVACDLLALGTPPEGEDLIRCARPALRLGRMEVARRLLAAFVAGAGSDPAARRNAALQAADVLEEAARFREAAEFLDLGSGPDAPSPVVLRKVHDLLRAGDARSARQAFERAVAEHAADRGFLREACLLFIRYGETGTASHAATLLATVPEFGEAEADTVILAAEAASDPALAERAARRLMAGETGTGDSDASGASSARSKALRAAAVLLERHGFGPVAVRLLEEGLRAGTLVVGDDLVLVARLLARHGRTEETHRVLSRAVEMRGEEEDSRKTGPDFWERVLGVWLDAGLPEEAVAFLRRHEAETDPAWVLACGRALHEAGRDDDESSLYEEAARRFSGSGTFEFWRRVARRYRDRPDLARAQGAVLAALRAATTDVERAHAHLDLAEVLLEAPSGTRKGGARGSERDVTSGAEAEVLAAMEVAGRDAGVAERLERLLGRLERTSGASLALLEAAVERDPTRADLWHRLATARLQARQFREALQAFQRWVEVSRREATGGEGPRETAGLDALAEAVSAFLDADRTPEAIALVVSFEKRWGMGNGRSASGWRAVPLPLPPEVSLRLGTACASARDRPCAARYLGRFLDAPIRPEADYLGCAGTLARLRLWTLAERAIAVAFKAVPPDQAWEVEICAAKVALARGRDDAAEAHFQKALESAPLKRMLIETAAQAYQDAGRLRLAASWWDRAVRDLEGSARLQALGRLIEALARLQDLGAIRDVVARVFPEPPSWPAAWTLMESLAEVGLLEEAVAVGRAVSGLGGASGVAAPTGPSGLPRPLPRTEGLQPEAVWPWLARLFVRAGHLDEALEVVRRVCLRPGEKPERDDFLCVEMTRALSGASRPREALEALGSRCRLVKCGPAILVEMADLRWRTGDIQGATAAAREAAARCETPEVLLERLGQHYRDARAWPRYVEVLEVLRARPEFANNPDVALALAEALLGAGREEEALALLRTHPGIGRDRGFEVYRLLATVGLWDEASRVLLEFPPALAFESTDGSRFRNAVVDLANAGRGDVVEQILEGIGGSDPTHLAQEWLGQVLADLGRHEESLAAFERVGKDQVSPDGIEDWIRVLWRTGRRERAFEVARAAVNHFRNRFEDEEDELGPECRSLIASFLDEEEVGPAWTLYSMCGETGIWEGDRGFGVRLAVAMVQTGEERFLEPARDVFLQWLVESEALRSDATEFIRIEVARRRADSLIEALGQWGSSRVLLEVRALVACLAKREEDLRDAIEMLTGPPDEPDPSSLRAAAASLLRCGRFSEAHRLAIRGLAAAGPGDPVAALARVAVQSGLAAGVTGAPRRVEGLVRARVEDRALAWRLVAQVRKHGGDWEGHAEARRHEADIGSSSWLTRMAAFSAALQAGDEVLAAHAVDRVLEVSSDRAEAVLDLAREARDRLREGVALPWLAREQEVWPGDRALARAALLIRVENGASSEDLVESALAYARTMVDSRAAWADVVDLAAEAMRLDLVEEGLRHLDASVSVPDDGEAEARMKAGLAYLRAGDEGQGRRLLVESVSRARDRNKALSRLAWLLVMDPTVPEDLSRFMLEHGPREVAGGPVPPSHRAVRCLAGGLDPADCVRTLPFDERVRWLQGAFRAALVSRRDRVARDLLGALLAQDASRDTALLAAATLVAAAWPAPPERREAVRELARVVREGLARTGTRSLLAYPWLEGVLTDLSEGPGAGLGAYLSRLSIAPADAEVRNNLAYYLSVGGVNVERALREARIAVALSSRGHPFYLETEAWAEFLRGNVSKAVVLQERASRLWQRGQGGGLAESFLHLGRMLEAVGRVDEARTAYRRAATLEPQEAAGIEALGRWRGLAGEAGGNVHWPRSSRVGTGKMEAP